MSDAVLPRLTERGARRRGRGLCYQFSREVGLLAARMLAAAKLFSH